jgi:hypothetical protein
MQTEQLREKLRLIARQDYQTTKIEIDELLPSMLQFSGSPDSELRDKLIYSTLATWIYRGMFTPDELQMVLQQALDDEHLFYKLGEENTDSVFTRAFSVLLVPPILWCHRQQPFLSLETLKSIYFTKGHVLPLRRKRFTWLRAGKGLGARCRTYRRRTR